MPMEYERKWEVRRGGGGRASDGEVPATYYGIPAIHKPHWKWMIIFYFFFGGIAGASYVIASIAQLFGRPEDRRITRAGRYISFAALIPSPILLILDLGRPERFLHMLRVLKLRSPMSVGSWGLTIFGAFSTLSALIQAADDGLFGRKTLLARILRAMPARMIGAAGTVPAFFLGAYTGVLLAATAVPIWAKNALLLGPLAVASAMSSASAALALCLSLARGTSHETLKRLERLDSITLVVELVLLTAARRNSGPVIGRPMNEGHLGRIYRFGVIGTGIGTPLALMAKSALLGRSTSRFVAALASVLTLAGGFMLRYLLVMTGRKSADDPEATFALTRARRERPEQP
ncbi:Protein NrfD [Nitrolancea hollandica Lb]|uniref:Protein NrfD n=2 Tax=Nitrolancea hollandica TaxID=1206749 RepID=I4EFE7_9BACT|nr:Protein NrfD [Nitrolancea hollandica Lb]